MADTKYLMPSAPTPDDNHVMVRPLPGGFEVSFFGKLKEGVAGSTRTIVNGDLAAALRIAEEWAASSGVDVIYVRQSMITPQSLEISN
ncbi:MAG TPA: hypothetical protein VHY35_12695 [Stellaceae bacterium]|jgi:hypothetical protein|nr:hypothetical protein [Stellaceae bacterium]